jgi:5'-nucleotidase
MHILVTNDDGVTAPGLLALVQAMRRLGRVSVLAPDHNWSATGHVRTLDRPLRVREVLLADGSLGLACDGAPSDCVAMGICGFFDEKVDLVVSGINPGANLGDDVTYSGTVTAAMEAAIAHIPAVAFSLDTLAHPTSPNAYGDTAQWAYTIIQSLLLYGMPENLLLNVNVPSLPGNEIKGIQVTRQGTRIYHDRLEQRVDPRGQPYYWILGDTPGGIPERGTDVGALAEGYVSITPIQLDMTAYAFIADLNARDWEASPQPARLPLPSIFLPG